MTNDLREGRHYSAKSDWTTRQKQVLDLLARGYTNREIAEDLGISLDGAKYHVSEIITRAGVDTREEAADYWRQRNGMRGRLRFALERMPGMAALRWAGIAVAGGGAAIAVAIATIAVIGNDSEPPAATTSPTPDTTPTAGPTATPSPDPDGDGTVVDLTAAEPAPLPGAILYYAVNLPSDAPYSYDRAYVDASGELIEEAMKLNIQAAVDGEVTAILDMRVAPGGRRIVVRACGPNCFVDVGAINPDTTVWWLESLDGGVTWQELGGRFDTLAPDAAVRLAGFAPDGQVLAHQNEGPLWAHPSGEEIPPPRDGVLPIVSRAGTVFWQELDSGTQPPRYWDNDGNQAFPLDDVEDVDPTAHGEKYRITFIDADDHAYYTRWVEDGTQIRVIDPAGEILRELRWPGFLGVVPSQFEGQLVGIAHGPGDDYEDQAQNLPASWQDGPRYPWRLVLIDVASGQIRPIADLQPLGLAPGGRILGPGGAGGSQPGLELMLQVEVLELVVPGDAVYRVNTPDSCLFVRDAPDQSAQEFHCYADGVLLGARDAAGEAGWVAVRTPDGNEGWASAAFLQR